MNRRSAILVHPDFDAEWPFVADDLQAIWTQQGRVEFIRSSGPFGGRLGNTSGIARLALLGVPVAPDELKDFPDLTTVSRPPNADEAWIENVRARGVAVVEARGQGFWGQSVSEFALGLVLCALRRIPQTHEAVRRADFRAWDYAPPDGTGRPGGRGQQFGDDPRFVNGTISGKRVRVVGMGNIGSRFSSYANMLGAEVAAWDPLAPDPCFHRAGTKRVKALEQLLPDAEIFAPMMPLVSATRGLITAEHIDRLPRGSLVVMVTRAEICDMTALRRRVIAGELALASDVFDVEPLPAEDPLLQCAHVIHTPHNAGRTREANRALAENLSEEFGPL